MSCAPSLFRRGVCHTRCGVDVVVSFPRYSDLKKKKLLKHIAGRQSFKSVARDTPLLQLQLPYDGEHFKLSDFWLSIFTNHVPQDHCCVELIHSEEEKTIVFVARYDALKEFALLKCPYCEKVCGPLKKKQENDSATTNESLEHHLQSHLRSRLDSVTCVYGA